MIRKIRDYVYWIWQDKVLDMKIHFIQLSLMDVWNLLFFSLQPHRPGANELKRVEVACVCEWRAWRDILLLVMMLLFIIMVIIMYNSMVFHDVTKWKHFRRHWFFVRGLPLSLVNSPHKGQWRGDLRFCLICALTNGWVNNRGAGDLRRHRAHYDVTFWR